MRPPEQLLEALRAHPDARVLAVVHAETSTGVRQPLEEIGAAVAGTDTLFLVDAVTSVGGLPVEVDRLGIDVCYAGTQKCLGVPPGLGPITFSSRAMERIAGAPRLGEERRYHHTAPINMVYALHEGLAMVEEEGLEARRLRHAEAGAALQEALVERGFELFAEEGHRLPQLTSASLLGGPRGRAAPECAAGTAWDRSRRWTRPSEGEDLADRTDGGGRHAGYR